MTTFYESNIVYCLLSNLSSTILITIKCQCINLHALIRSLFATLTQPAANPFDVIVIKSFVCRHIIIITHLPSSVSSTAPCQFKRQKPFNKNYGLIGLSTWHILGTM